MFLALPTISRIKRNKKIENLNKFELIAKTLPSISEIVDHKKNGFVAKPFDCTEFANGINWIHNLDSVALKNTSQNARKKALDEYSLKAQATSYFKLIKSIV